MGVVILVLSARVEIHGVGDSRVKNDKDGAPVAAGKKPSNYSPYEREGMIEMYERVVRHRLTLDDKAGGQFPGPYSVP